MAQYMTIYEYISIFSIMWLFVWIFCMGLSVIAYSSIHRARFKSYPSQQMNLWNSRMRAGGHGMVYDRETNTVKNSITVEECRSKSLYFENNKKSIFRKLAMRYFISESLTNALISAVPTIIVFFIFMWA